MAKQKTEDPLECIIDEDEDEPDPENEDEDDEEQNMEANRPPVTRAEKQLVRLAQEHHARSSHAPAPTHNGCCSQCYAAVLQAHPDLYAAYCEQKEAQGLIQKLKSLGVVTVS